MLLTLHSFLYVLNIAYFLKYVRHYYVEKVKYGIHTVVGLLRCGKIIEMEKSSLALCPMSVSENVSESSLTKENPGW